METKLMKRTKTFSLRFMAIVFSFYILQAACICMAGEVSQPREQKKMKVVLLGDSIRMGYQQVVKEALGGIADVWAPKENCQDSAFILSHLDKWLVGKQPDIVYINCGLHDAFIDSGTQVRRSPEKYGANLEQIFSRIKKASKGATIIFALTTPVDEKKQQKSKTYGRLVRRNKDIDALNTVAAEKAAKYGIKTDDLHGLMIKYGGGSLLISDGIHPDTKGADILGRHVADTIKRALSVRQYGSSSYDNFDASGYAFLPSSASVKPNLLPVTPTGCKEFNVELPRPKTKLSVSVAEFGASQELKDNTEAFNAAIRHCASKNASRLTVPKGIYRFHSQDSVRFNKLTDFEFDGGGSTFLFKRDKVTNSFITVSNCERVLFKNFNIDWGDWEKDPLASIVKVKDVSPSGDWAVVQFINYDDFPKKNLRIVGLSQVDEKTMSAGCENAARTYFTTVPGRNPVPKTQWLSKNTLKIYSDSARNRFNLYKNGTLHLMRHYGYDMFAFYMISNVNLTLSDINVYSCPGTAFRVQGAQHHWHFLNVNVIKPPKETWRPITSTCDVIHTNQSLGYLKVENCDFSFSGDDFIYIHDSNCFATMVGERKLTAIISYSMASELRVGDSIGLLNSDDLAPIDFTKKIVKLEFDPKTRKSAITLDGDLPGRIGDSFVVYNRRFDSSNLIIRNCRFSTNRGRGILIASNNVTIENNRFFHTERSAILICMGYSKYWADGKEVSNIVIRNNVFDSISPLKERELFPVIYLSPYFFTDPSREKTNYPVFRDLLITGNKFINFPGAIIFAASSKNLIISENTISRSVPRKTEFKYSGAVGVEYSYDIFLTGNKWLKTKLMPMPGVFFNRYTTKGVYSWDNAYFSDGQQSKTTEH